MDKASQALENSQDALNMIKTHERIYLNDKKEIDDKMKTIFDKLDAMSGRWFYAACATITILLSACGWLINVLLKAKGIV